MAEGLPMKIIIVTFMTISSFLEYLISVPKSMYCSLKLCPIKQAVKLPMLVRYNTSILSLRGG